MIITFLFLLSFSSFSVIIPLSFTSPYGRMSSKHHFNCGHESSVYFGQPSQILPISLSASVHSLSFNTFLFHFLVTSFSISANFPSDSALFSIIFLRFHIHSLQHARHHLNVECSLKFTFHFVSTFCSFAFIFRAVPIHFITSCNMSSSAYFSLQSTL